MLYPLLIIHILSAVFHIVNANTLYTAEDPIVLLNSSTFDGVIFGKDKVWVVEFFNRWCGHCVRFAPIYKEFARDIEAWKPVVDVAAIDCVDSSNVETCRYYGIQGYPTIKHFWVNATKKYKGEAAPHAPDPPSLRKTVINFIEDSWRLGVPKHWPEIQSYRIDQIQDTLRHDKKILAVIIEPPKSYVGKETILDMSAFRDVRIVRLLSLENDLTGRQFARNVEIDSLPVMIILKSDNSAELLVNPQSPDTARFEFTAALKKKLFGEKWNSSSDSLDKSDVVPGGPGLGEHKTDQGVYMVDLENAIGYSLRQEVGLKERIVGEHFSSLKSFLRNLSKYFPGRPAVVNFLKKLYRWVSGKQGELTAEEYLSALNDLQDSDSVLPVMKPWMGCRGSSDRYRGYPCSLWTLFHTLTVEAFARHRSGRANKPQQVLLSIRNYVRDFFTCKYCAEHFMQMAVSMEEELVRPEDGVMWLWQAHNKVNKRLAGDETEDPAHPKVQFPPESLCPSCRSQDEPGDDGFPQWNRDAALDFLMSFYKRTNIRMSGLEPLQTSKTSSPDGKPEVKTIDDHVLPSEVDRDASSKQETDKNTSGWSFKYFSEADVSLCIILYVSSGALLVLAALIFKLRKRRRRMRNGKLFIGQP